MGDAVRAPLVHRPSTARSEALDSESDYYRVDHRLPTTRIFPLSSFVSFRIFIYLLIHSTPL